MKENGIRMRKGRESTTYASEIIKSPLKIRKTRLLLNHCGYKAEKNKRKWDRDEKKGRKVLPLHQKPLQL